VKVDHDDPAAPGNPGSPAAPKPSGPSGILAHTGAAILTATGITGALLLIGALALGLSRRRRRNG
jgi:LPXTG-motif cell wall-anchored protein